MALFDPRPDMPLEELRTRLVHAMTVHDRKMSAQPRAHWSPRALAHYLRAIEEVEADARAGVNFPDAVMRHLLPAPWLRTWLRKLDPSIDVRHGQWTRSGEAVNVGY